MFLTPSIYAQSCEMQHSTQSPIIMHIVCYTYKIYPLNHSRGPNGLVIQTRRHRLLGIAKKAFYAFLLPFICGAQFAIYFCNLTRDAEPRMKLESGDGDGPKDQRARKWGLDATKLQQTAQ